MYEQSSVFGVVVVVVVAAIVVLVVVVVIIGGAGAGAGARGGGLTPVVDSSIRTTDAVRKSLPTEAGSARPKHIPAT